MHPLGLLRKELLRNQEVSHRPEHSKPGDCELFFTAPHKRHLDVSACFCTLLCTCFVRERVRSQVAQVALHLNTDATPSFKAPTRNLCMTSHSKSQEPTSKQGATATTSALSSTVVYGRTLILLILVTRISESLCLPGIPITQNREGSRTPLLPVAPAFVSIIQRFACHDVSGQSFRRVRGNAGVSIITNTILRASYYTYTYSIMGPKTLLT